MPIPSKTLKMLRPITLYQSGPPFRPFFAPFADRIANAASPCLLMLIARLGIKVSKRRNSSEGIRKKTARMPSVPTISTFSGEKERTSVLHV